MKYLLMEAALAGSLSFSLCVPPEIRAWDGFDAASTDLVEVNPDRVPSPGETVDVRNYDTDTTETCLVESVSRNARTVELVVRTSAGATRTLVMEGR